MTSTAKKRQAKPDEATGTAHNRFQSFEVVRVHRSELKNAPYNPRTLSEKARKRLKAVLKKHGMVEPQVWNRRTGNLVGGHQRTKVLDDLNGTNDYTLDVSAIDVDEKAEAALCIALNNNEAQGDWDIDKLGALLKSPDIDIASTGFDVADVYNMFGDEGLENRDVSEIDKLNSRLRDMEERVSEIRGLSSSRDRADFYFVAVFRDVDARFDAMEEMGLDPETNFHDGRLLLDLLRRGRNEQEA